MNNFLRNGQKSNVASTSNDGDGDNNPNDCDMKMDAEQSGSANECSGESSALVENIMITSNQPQIPIDIDNILEVIENADSGNSANKLNTQTQNIEASSSNKNSDYEKIESEVVVGPDPTKPLRLKAKVLRQQRKAEKLLTKTNSPNPPNMDAKDGTTIAAAVAKKPSKNMEKTLKSFTDEMLADGKHKLQVT